MFLENRPSCLTDFADLNDAEEELIAATHAGRTARIGAAKPKEPRFELSIRASLIRYILLGGCDAFQPHESGIRLRGAVIAHDSERSKVSLSLDDLKLAIGADFENCLFEKQVSLKRTSAKFLSFRGSVFRGSILANGLTTSEVFSIKSSEIDGSVDIPDARIGRDFIASNVIVTGTIYVDRANLGGSFEVDGATILGKLDLSNARARADLSIVGTTIENGVLLPEADLKGNLVLKNSTIRRRQTGDNRDNEEYCIEASRANIGRNFEVENSLIEDGCNLHETTIHGSINSVSSEFKVFGRKPAIMGDRISVAKGVYFSAHENGRNPRISGQVKLAGANIHGDLAFEGIQLRVPYEDDTSLDLQGARVERNFRLIRGTKIRGRISLNSAKVGQLIDSKRCWPKTPMSLDLDQFEYDAISGYDAPTDAAFRLQWLANQLEGSKFLPQRYEQCAKVLSKMGHEVQSRAVLIEKERIQRKALFEVQKIEASRLSALSRSAQYIYIHFKRSFDLARGWITGYGYKPFKSLFPLAGLLLIGTLLFYFADQKDALKPNNAFVLMKETWQKCADSKIDTQRDCFELKSRGSQYPKFNALIYSLDTLVPLVSLEMQEYWVPDESKPGGWVTRFYLWLHICLGWFFSVLTLAGVTGLIRAK